MKGGLGLKIGMIQLAAIEGDVSGNCTKIRNWVKTYAGQDYDILCFPELCISGYEFEKTEHASSYNKSGNQNNTEHEPHKSL